MTYNWRFFAASFCSGALLFCQQELAPMSYVAAAIISGGLTFIIYSLGVANGRSTH